MKDDNGKSHPKVKKSNKKSNTLKFCGMARIWSQIPNAGFENWTNTEPNGWLTNNDTLTSIFPVTQSTNSHDGAAALQASVVSVSGFSFMPLAISGPTTDGFPVGARYPALLGFVRLTSVGGDRVAITIVMRQGGVGIGAGAYVDSLTRTSYRQFAALITYCTCYVGS